MASFKRVLSLQAIFLFILAALFEITGCYLPYLYLKQGRSPWLLAPAALSLGIFAWLLTLQSTAAGRTYAAYGGIYVTIALFWLWMVEKIKPDRWDLIGASVALIGMAIILFMPRSL